MKYRSGMCKCNIEVRSLKHFAVQKGKFYILGVLVASVIKHAMRMRRYYAVICGLSGSTIFFHIIS